MQVEEQQLELNMEHRLVWERGESKITGRNIRLLEVTSDMQMIPPLWQKAKSKEPPDEGESERGE